jgi:hypothetical protein
VGGAPADLVEVKEPKVVGVAEHSKALREPLVPFQFCQAQSSQFPSPKSLWSTIHEPLLADKPTAVSVTPAASRAS